MYMVSFTPPCLQKLDGNNAYGSDNVEPGVPYGYSSAHTQGIGGHDCSRRHFLSHYHFEMAAHPTWQSQLGRTQVDICVLNDSVRAGF